MVVPPALLRPPRGSLHHLAEAAADDDAAALGEQPPDLLGLGGPLDAAPDHGDLHGPMI